MHVFAACLPQPANVSRSPTSPSLSPDTASTLRQRLRGGKSHRTRHNGSRTFAAQLKRRHAQDVQARRAELRMWRRARSDRADPERRDRDEDPDALAAARDGRELPANSRSAVECGLQPGAGGQRRDRSAVLRRRRRVARSGVRASGCVDWRRPAALEARERPRVAAMLPRPNTGLPVRLMGRKRPRLDA